MQRSCWVRLSISQGGSDRGATIVEYVVLISTIALLLAASVKLLGADVQTFFLRVTALWH